MYDKIQAISILILLRQIVVLKSYIVVLGLGITTKIDVKVKIVRPTKLADMLSHSMYLFLLTGPCSVYVLS